jgi:hypothetical protein
MEAFVTLVNNSFGGERAQCPGDFLAELRENHRIDDGGWWKIQKRWL